MDGGSDLEHHDPDEAAATVAELILEADATRNVPSTETRADAARKLPRDLGSYSGESMSQSVGWSTSKHDTVGISLWMNPLEGHAYLEAFLSADGQHFAPPYEAVRTPLEEALARRKERQRKGQAPSADISVERIRTWKSLFESFGLVLVDGETQHLHSTPLGRAVRAMYEELNRRVEGQTITSPCWQRPCSPGTGSGNPIHGGTYPQDADLHPFRAIWRAMRALDDKLHWQELNRVIMHLNYEHEVPDAIEKIRAERKAAGGGYTDAQAESLGAPVVPPGPETVRRITPWFARAGFGGLLIAPDADSSGFRHLNPKYTQLIDSAIDEAKPVPAEAIITRSAYLRYLTEQHDVVASATADDKADVQRVIAAVERYGDSKIIALSGIPGTGKTRLARLVAAALVDESHRLAEVQFHENTTYDSFVQGFVPKQGGEGFELRPKVFRVINRRARLDPADARYVLLIEELTRGNVHAVLGELLRISSIATVRSNGRSPKKKTSSLPTWS